jgi:hypothetical protein
MIDSHGTTNRPSWGIDPDLDRGEYTVRGMPGCRPSFRVTTWRSVSAAEVADCACNEALETNRSWRIDCHSEASLHPCR